MQKASSVYKIPNGKLLKVDLEYETSADDQKVIFTVKLHGDFFVHPEIAIENLENILKGIPLDETRISEHIQEYVDSQAVSLFGLDAPGIAHGIMLCLVTKKE